MTDLRSWTALLLERARGLGAAAAEVSITETSIRSLGGRRESAKAPSTETRLAVRVWDSVGRVGLALGHAANEAASLGLVDRASALAASASPDPSEGPAERMEVPTLGLQIADPRFGRLDDTVRREVIAQNEDGARAAGKAVSLVGFTYDEIAVRRAVATTRGFDGLENGTRFRLRGAVRHNSQPDGEVSATVESRRFADVASVPLGADLARRAQTLATPVAWPDKTLPLVLEPRVLALLLPRIAAAFDAERVSAGRSFLSARPSFGASIGSTRLHLVDDGSLPGALETRAFDDRGVPPMPLPLVREGTLGALYQTPRTGRQRGSSPTGHATGEGGVWPGNLIIRPGGRSRNMMFPDVGRYLLVDEILDFSGLNVETGAVLLPLRLALGELGHVLGSLGRATLRTTIFDLFGSISEMASDTDRNGSVDACTWVMSGLEVARG